MVRVRAAYERVQYGIRQSEEYGSVREAILRAWHDARYFEAIVRRITCNGTVLLDNPYGRTDLLPEIERLASQYRVTVPHRPTLQEQRESERVLQMANETAPSASWTYTAGAASAVDAGGAITLVAGRTTKPDGYECPRCKATGKTARRWWIVLLDYEPCTLCGGTGSVFDLLYGVPEWATA